MERIATTQAEVVIEEESFETQAGTLKPDLVITDKERVHVIDVTVHHKDVGYLQAGFHDKMNKYSPLLPLLADRFNTNQGKDCQSSSDRGERSQNALLHL
jgi:hypothetical protein